MSLTDSEILHDFNCMRGIVERIEEIAVENNKSAMDIEEKLEKQSVEKAENQNKAIEIEKEENEDRNSNLMSCEEEENLDNDRNNVSGINSSKNGSGNNLKKKNISSAKNYSLRKINNVNSKGTKTETDEAAKLKEKIDSTRVLRNRKKNN